MSEIDWFEIGYNGQKIDKDDDRYEEGDEAGVCCQELYDIVREATIKCFQNWNLYRTPHFEEFLCAWEMRKPEKYFECKYDFRDIYREAKTDIVKFFQKHLNRRPNEVELHTVYNHMWKNWDKYVYVEGDKNETEEIDQEKIWEFYDARKKSGNIYVTSCIEVATCCFCGKPIYGYGNGSYKDAGEIEISFGYGSRRDTDFGTGLIHDLCAAKLTQNEFKGKFKWDSHFHDNLEIDIEKSEKEDRIHYKESW